MTQTGQVVVASSSCAEVSLLRLMVVAGDMSVSGEFGGGFLGGCVVDEFSAGLRGGDEGSDGGVVELAG